MEKRVWAAAAMTALLALSSVSAAQAAEAYDINVVIPLSGPVAFLGKGELQTLGLAEKVVNAAGGIKGRPLHYILHDDESNPQVTVQLVGEVEAEKPAVLLGSSLVASCRAIAPLMQNGPVNYCLSPGIHPDAGSYVFTASVSTLDLANAVIRYFRMKGWTRIALMFSTDATGQDAESGLKHILSLPENKAMQVVQIAHFNTTDVSVSAQIENVKAANPQCFIAWSTGAPIGTIFRGLVQAGLDVPTATTDGNMTYAQMTQYADFLPKQLYIPAAEWVVTDPKLLAPAVAEKHKEFYDAFAAAGIKPDVSSELAWDAGMLFVQALRTLGPQATAAQVRGFIARQSDLPGVNGIYNYVKVPQRGLDVSNAVVTRWSVAAKTWQVVSKPTGVPLE